MQAPNQNQNDNSIMDIFPDFRCTKPIAVFAFLAIMAFVGVLFYNWGDLTPCAQRQAIAVIIALMFWQFRGDNLASFFGEILQVTVVFIIIQKLNMTDMQDGKPCLETYTPFSKSIYIMYVFFFSYYMGLAMIMAFLMSGYILHECMGGNVATGHRRTLRSVRGRDFEALEKVKFSVSTLTSLSNQTMCSICLSEFEEQEEIIKLPVCNHCFHNNCLKTWLETHVECPYCRSNIKSNLRSIRDEQLNSSLHNLEESLQDSSVVVSDNQSSIIDIPINIPGMARDVVLPPLNPGDAYVEMMNIRRNL